MSIESLRLKGFKSFGAPCEFTFHEGFTAIVGPNGSGKSNILDALRWILGEGGNGALRIVRQSDLLFQGTASVPKAKEAEVVLALSSGAGGADRAVLRRTWSADDGSTLLLDGKRILLQDLDGVKQRFSMEGEGFAFIGQGEVSAAIHQRPRERRRQLDLLFGVERYRQRRDDGLARLEEALGEGQRIQTLIQELELRRSELAGEVEIAARAKEMLDALEGLRRNFYFSRRATIEAEEAELRARREGLLARLDASSAWLGTWGEALEDAEDRLRSQGSDEPALVARAEELAARTEALGRRSFQEGTRIRAILDARAQIEEERGELEGQERVLIEELRAAERERAEVEAQLEASRSALEARLREMEEGRAQIERDRARRQALRDELAGLRLACSRAEAELRALSASGETEDEELARLREEERRKGERAGELSRRLGELEAAREAAMAAHVDAAAAAQRQAAGLQQLRRERARQEAELDSLRDSAASSHPKPVQFLLSAPRLGRMRSRPRAVAEAFTCPPHIAPALDAYLGGRQSWLLVHTMEEAQEGIELLKKHQAGRATYLPLERCRPRERDWRATLPAKGVVGWAMDLIETLEPWGPALAHLAGDLLIVEGYALGSSLVGQGARYPIVTIEGEVFAPGGTVSGGRGPQRASAIASGRQIAGLQADIEALRSRIQEMERGAKAAEAKEQELAARAEALAVERDALRAEEAEERRALGALVASLERATSQREEARERTKVLEMELASSSARLVEAEGELAALGEEGTDEGAGTALTSLRADASLAEERLKGTRAIAERMAKERDGLRARVVALEGELEDGRAEERERRAALGEIGRERLALHEEGRALRARLDEERARMERGRSRLGRLRGRRARAEDVVAARRAELVATGERARSLEAERRQLTELWDEKHPYDATAARALDGREDIVSSLRKTERDLKALGPYDLGALSEDASLAERVEFLAEQLADVRGAADELRELIRTTDLQVEATFTSSLSEIDARFDALFKRLFGGGEARLTLQDGESIWDRGVEIYARPPGKALQNIAQLSGGEQSLTAIAQLFSALEVAGVPLAVLDEVDAALDEHNLIRFADLAKEHSRSIQIVVMTHRRATMERADTIYGVTMVEPGLSKIVGIDVEKYR